MLCNEVGIYTGFVFVPYDNIGWTKTSPVTAVGQCHLPSVASP